MGRDMRQFELITDQVPGIPAGVKSSYNQSDGVYEFYGRKEAVYYSFVNNENVIFNMINRGIIKEVFDYEDKIKEVGWNAGHGHKRYWAIHPVLDLSIYADSYKDIYEIIAKP